MITSSSKYCVECGEELSSYRKAMEWKQCMECDL